MARKKKTPVLEPGQVLDGTGVVWDTAESLAAARGIEEPTIIRRLLDLRKEAARRDGSWPVGFDVVPRPDSGVHPVTGRTMHVWRADRADVRTWKARGLGSGRPAVLDDPVWLAAEYAPPPAGKGRTVYAIGKELGVARAVVEAALGRHGIPLRSTGGGKLAGRSLLDLERAVRDAGSIAAAAAEAGVTHVTFGRALKVAPVPTDPAEVAELERVRAEHAANVAAGRRQAAGAAVAANVARGARRANP